jgi:synaptojanin
LFAVDQVCGVDDNMILINIDYEQLRHAMDTGVAFAGYTEGPLLFRPTYRYDAGTDYYDTSDKMRIPAWTGKQNCNKMAFDSHFTTDRILYHGTQLDLSVYSRSELRGSDHKPGKNLT